MSAGGLRASDDPRTLTIDALLAARRPKPCAIRGCVNAGAIGTSVRGNSAWFCWGHLLQFNQAMTVGTAG